MRSRPLTTPASRTESMAHLMAQTTNKGAEQGLVVESHQCLMLPINGKREEIVLIQSTGQFRRVRRASWFSPWPGNSPRPRA